MTALFDNQGRPSFSLLKILDVLKINYDHSLNGIVDITQRTLLRSPGKERWEVEDIFKDKSKTLTPLFKEIGCIDAIHASCSLYDYGVVLGALFGRVRDRLQWLINEWCRGVRFKTLVFLTGKRALIDSECKDLKIFSKKQPIPTDEFEMVKLVYATLEMPQAMKNLPVVFINAQPQVGRPRVNTEDTVRTWLGQCPEPGTVLAVSNQPYIMQQHCVLRALLPKEFYIETVGPEISNLTTTTLILDNLARWIFQIKRLFDTHYSSQTVNS